jgi:hypothetical protein
MNHADRIRQIADVPTRQLQPIRGDLLAAADYIEHLEAEAERVAQTYGWELVELTGELPDPPHEWKVGDWAKNPTTPMLRRQIVAMDSRGVLWFDTAGHYGLMQSVPKHWQPCNPPAWFTEGELPDPPKTVTVDGATWTLAEDRWTSTVDPNDWALRGSRRGVLLDRIWDLEQQIGGAS